MYQVKPDPENETDVRRFVLNERRQAVSDREWRHRLRGYGYALRVTAKGEMICTLPDGEPICTLWDRTIVM